MRVLEEPRGAAVLEGVEMAVVFAGVWGVDGLIGREEDDCFPNKYPH